MDAIKQAWLNLYQSGVERVSQISDPALKKHFEQENKQIKLTLNAMDIKDPADTPDGITLQDNNPAKPQNDLDIADASIQGKITTPSSSNLATSAPAATPAPVAKPVLASVPAPAPPATPEVLSAPLAPIAASATPSVASSSEVDSNKKYEKLKPLIDNASRLTNVPASLLGAVMTKESRGVSIDDMKKAGGLMQLGAAEFSETQAKHPELKGLDPFSTEGQIMGTAFRLKDLKDKSGSWDGALTMYNGGENGGGKLNDPNYLTLVNSFQKILEQGGQLPS